MVPVTIIYRVLIVRKTQTHISLKNNYIYKKKYHHFLDLECDLSKTWVLTLSLVDKYSVIA